MNYYKNFLRTVKAYLARQLGLKSGALVLDCGTGRGLFASALVDLARVSVMSVDSSMDSIKEAILELKGKVELIRADLHFLPFLKSTFDYVVSESTIHEVPLDNLEKVLGEMKRVVKPFGKVIAIDMLPHPEDELQESFLERHHLLEEIQRSRGLHEKFYEKKVLKEALELAGLSEVKAKIIKKEFRMPLQAIKESMDRLEKVHLKKMEVPTSDLKKRISTLRKRALRVGMSLPPAIIVWGTKK